MSAGSKRPLSLGNLRAFEAVARHLSFNAAADELHVTQSAVSRQIKSLEDELGAPLFQRGTRHVHLAPDGALLLRAVEPWLAKLDGAVRQVRRARTRPRIGVTTFASFGSLWLLPRIEAFQKHNPEIDIRVATSDALLDLDDPELDLALRNCLPQQAGDGAVRLFGETVTPVISRGYAERVARGDAPPLASIPDLARHAFIEQADDAPMAANLNWGHWLAGQRHAELQPRSWMVLDYTHQQVQAVLAGQGVALGRLALIVEELARGELVEPFGDAGRICTPYAYWMVAHRGALERPEVAAFAARVEAEAALTRAAVGGEGRPC